MKVLEIAPLEDKKLSVLIIEKEYDEPFWLGEANPELLSGKLRHIFSTSIAFSTFVERLIKKVGPDFATEELGMRSSEGFYEDNVLARLFQRSSVPFFHTDIDDYARTYLEASIDEKRQSRDQVLQTLTRLSKRKTKSKKARMKRDYLVAYAQCLQQELEEELHEVCFDIREAWIVMGILDRARKVDKNQVVCLHISSPEHAKGVMDLLRSVGAKVEIIKISKKVVSTHSEKSSEAESTDFPESMQIQVKPIIKKASDEAPSLLFFLDTDSRASPFDICMAYDAGFNAVIPYEGVNPEAAKRIVQDAMFAREHKWIKRTCFFVGGKSKEKAEEVLETIKKTMFPPFVAPVIIDPSGAYTTAAAMIAKVEHALSTHKLGNLGDKTCAVFGTGAVGRITAVLLARLGCDVTILSTNPKRSDGEEYIESVSKSLLKKYGVGVKGVYASSMKQKVDVLEKADIILCAAAPEARIIEAEMLEKLKLMKVVVDINAIPPSGIEGMKPEDDMREIRKGIFGIGPLTVGKLKYRLEGEILREVRNIGKGIYDYNIGLQLARELLQKRITPADLEVTLTYQS